MTFGISLSWTGEGDAPGWYRVFVGRFATEDEAKAYATWLLQNQWVDALWRQDWQLTDVTVTGSTLVLTAAGETMPLCRDVTELISRYGTDISGVEIMSGTSRTSCAMAAPSPIKRRPSSWR